MVPRTLALTSPMMVGDDVRRAQGLMSKNSYGDFFDGTIDGEYGEYTASAAMRTRFWLGYPETGANTWHNGVVGPRLGSFLDGSKPLPKGYLIRARARKKAKPKTPLREKALNSAISKLGLTESPAGSNICFASTWYGLIGPWCAMFVTYAYEFGGPSEAFDKHAARWAYVPFMVSDARQGRNYLAVVNEPKPGDVVCYRFGSDTWQHVGVFEKWLTGRSTFSAIEGNTSAGNNANGGAVQRRQRNVSDGVVFIHVGR